MHVIRFLFFLIVLSLGNSSFVWAEIAVQKGILDLRGHDINEVNEIKFNGEWEFYWGKLLTSDDFKNKLVDTIRYIHVPSVWTDYEINGKKLPAKGAATYRLNVLVDSSHGKMAIKVGGIGTAFSLFVDGKNLLNGGKVSLLEADAEPGYNPGVVSFYPKSDTIELIFQVSNYHYCKGGIWDSFGKIGSVAKIINSWDRDIQLSVLFIGCILIFALYHLGLYLLNQNFHYTLYFSLFCIIIILRTIVVNEIFLLDIFPNFSWVALIKIEYLTLLLGTIAFSLFIYKFFIEEYSVILLKIILIISSFFSLVVLIMPPLFFTQFLTLFQLNILLGASYIIIVVTKALIKKKQSALILLVGFSVLMLAIINDMLYTNRVIDTLLLTSFGFIVFIFSQSYMLSERFATLLMETESLGKSLETTNINLEKLVTKRTVKIQEQNALLQEQSQLILTKKAALEEQLDEIKTQRDNLKKQNEIANRQKKQITNSIEYASKIQGAVLKRTHLIEHISPDNFILFKPKDIVSGDFYWFKVLEIKDRKIGIAALVDCTGHGVPGALMSIMGAMFLNKIIDDLRSTFTAAEILNKMRTEVKNLLRQYSNENTVKDGMEMALIVIDFTAMKIQFAGAHNPLYIIRNENMQPSKEIEEYKGDNMPIGIYIKEKETFTNYNIDIIKGDLIYLFSDGYYDQFGGEFGKKFKKETFKQILLANAHLTLPEQKVILEQELLKWQGKYDQIDDITVIGLKI